jgi:hypothetical protein
LSGQRDLVAARDRLFTDLLGWVIGIEQPGFGRAGGLDTAQEQGLGLLFVSVYSIITSGQL